MDASSKECITIDTIVFDLDGTVATGNGPIIAYARLVSEAAGAQGPALARRLVEEIAEAEATGMFPAPVLDGYDLVRLRALDAGVEPASIDEAYRSSRSLLGTAQAPVTLPEGLTDLLDALGDRVRLALVTNAPATRLDEVLTSLGLESRFHSVHTSAGKPDGLRRLATGWAVEGRVLSVGDIWGNDLEPVHALGGDTALVGRPPEDASPTYWSPTLPGLYENVLRWSHAARPSSPDPRSANPNERESTPS